MNFLEDFLKGFCIKKEIVLNAGSWHKYHFSLEHVYMRPEMNSNRFEISLWGKISLWYKVTSLLAFA